MIILIYLSSVPKVYSGDGVRYSVLWGISVCLFGDRVLPGLCQNRD